MQWSLLDRQMDAALAQYEKWGIAGIKVDFMDRNDQQMVDYYHKLMAKAAEHKLLVDMHGAYPPAGLNRTYPNYLTQEGIMGAEYNKWSRRVTATHNVSLAYTRMLLGPMDYTPGGFRNRDAGDVRGGELAAAGADHARPWARHVRGVREPVPDGGRQPGCLSERGRVSTS